MAYTTHDITRLQKTLAPAVYEALKLADGIDPADLHLSRTLVEAVTERREGVLMIDTRTDAKDSAAIAMA